MKLQTLYEENDKYLIKLADKIIDQLADERHFQHSTIMNLAKRELKQHPQYADNPEAMKIALKTISDYVAK
jgi:hypothetical protein